MKLWQKLSIFYCDFIFAFQNLMFLTFKFLMITGMNLLSLWAYITLFHRYSFKALNTLIIDIDLLLILFDYQKFIKIILNTSFIGLLLAEFKPTIKWACNISSKYLPLHGSFISKNLLIITLISIWNSQPLFSYIKIYV